MGRYNIGFGNSLLYFNHIIFIKYIIKLTCESFIAIGAHVFENSMENSCMFFHVFMLNKKLPDIQN